MKEFMLPVLKTGNEQIDKAFRIALGDIVGNILPFKDGLLENEENVFIAGMDYNTPWTRDAAINTWNGCGLLFPEISKNTLFSVLKQEDSKIVIGGQYWDAIIWVIGAWWYYIYTGDKEFIDFAFGVSQNALKYFESREFDKDLHLFRGAACYGDGVGAYPDVYLNTNGHSDITYWVEANPKKAAKEGFGLPMFALSTNCLYCKAYEITHLMSLEINKPCKSNWKQKSEDLKKAINKNFWNEDKGRYNYLVDSFGGSDFQEGMGQSFALLFNIANEEMKTKLFDNTYLSDFGIPCLWPIFQRYKNLGDTIFGVHNGSIWPHIQAFWAEAAVKANKQDVFFRELSSVAKNVCRDKQFGEYYSPFTGKIEFGHQEGWYMYPRYEIHEWEPASRQTWSATAYIRMILYGLLGMEFNVNEINFKPNLPENMNNVSFKNLRYRNMILNLTIKGNGRNIKSYTINGLESKNIVLKAANKGIVNITIEMGD